MHNFQISIVSAVKKYKQCLKTASTSCRSPQTLYQDVAQAWTPLGNFPRHPWLQPPIKFPGVATVCHSPEAHDDVTAAVECGASLAHSRFYLLETHSNTVVLVVNVMYVAWQRMQ